MLATKWNDNLQHTSNIISIDNSTYRISISHTKFKCLVKFIADKIPKFICVAIQIENFMILNNFRLFIVLYNTKFTLYFGNKIIRNAVACALTINCCKSLEKYMVFGMSSWKTIWLPFSLETQFISFHSDSHPIPVFCDSPIQIDIYLLWNAYDVHRFSIFFCLLALLQQNRIKKYLARKNCKQMHAMCIVLNGKPCIKKKKERKLIFYLKRNSDERALFRALGISFLN